MFPPVCNRISDWNRTSCGVCIYSALRMNIHLYYLLEKFEFALRHFNRHSVLFANPFLSFYRLPFGCIALAEALVYNMCSIGLHAAGADVTICALIEVFSVAVATCVAFRASEVFQYHKVSHSPEFLSSWRLFGCRSELYLEAICSMIHLKRDLLWV